MASTYGSIVPLFAGSYRVAIEGEIGKLEDNHVFQQGKDYKLELSARSLPIATFTFVNTGKAALSVALAGPTKKSVRVSPLQSLEVPVLAGEYILTGRIPGASRTDERGVGKGDNVTVEYRYTGAVFDPSTLVVDNGGNASFTLSMRGKRSYSFNVPPGGKTFTVAAGVYDIEASCGGQSSGSEQHELEPGSEAQIGSYACQIYYR
jgi:hypothetical protein